MSTAVIPEPIAQLQRQLDQFRSTQPRGTKLPESLWQAAVELARQHGVYSVAHPLRLDYMGLKKRLGGVSRSPTKGTQAGIRGTDRAACQRCWKSASSSSSRCAEARCAFSGKRPHRPIGRACCGPGGKQRDDSDHGADARAGGHRAGRWTKRDRLSSATVPGETRRGSFFRLCVRVSEPQRDGDPATQL